MRISDWSSDVCSSDLLADGAPAYRGKGGARGWDRRHRFPRGKGRLDALLSATDRPRRRGSRPRCARRRRGAARPRLNRARTRSEEHTSELQSLMRISYAVFCLKKKKINNLKRHLYSYHNLT